MSINIDRISRNSNSFKFVEALGSFIQNTKFSTGYNQYASQKDTKDAYIWNALSVIGDKYAETIYENVINYIDNAANVDLCKINVLQSMLQVVGLQYDVFDTFKTIPVEIANLMDILSINKSYLLNSQVFNEAFIDDLSSMGCIQQSTSSTELSNVIDEKYDAAKDVHVSKEYINEEKYKDFLVNLYKQILLKYVYLQYADAENGLPSDKHYIFEYIQKEILANQANANVVDMTPYEMEMSQLKIKYNINKDFDQQKIVDDIENGYDSISKYNIYEQQILKKEILRREQTYSYDKTYDTTQQKFLGFNLTRYSYYREKKVKEYFRFIENTYNNLIIETNIADAIAGRITDVDTIVSYDKDVNYFDINQSIRKYLLEYNSATNTYEIQLSYIIAIAELLANQTLQIAEIRDQIKLQMRKSYMRGTFLLMSYIVNEFLRYGILDKYGSSFSTDDGVTLGSILKRALEGNPTELIEYYDDTEYFNITTSSDAYAKYADTVNEKFWDNAYNKIGKQTEDIPLNEIEHFYLKQLQLDKNHVDDIVNFLSIVYEYGANNSYINKMTDEFTCQLHDGQWIGDPYNKISSLEEDKLQIKTIRDGVDEYIEKGYEQTLSTLDYELKDLCSYVSTYYTNEILDANAQLTESIDDEYDKNLEDFRQIEEAFNEISSSYEDLKSNSMYKYYLQYGYNTKYYTEPTSPHPYFIEKVQNLMLSILNENGITWNYSGLYEDLNRKLASYYSLSSGLYNTLFKLSVWTNTSDTEYWPYYSPQFDNEITAVTYDLKNFLINEAQSNLEKATQHLQNHYEKLLSYKEEINNILGECNASIAKLQAFRGAVEAATGTTFNESITSSYIYWSAPMYTTTTKVKNGEVEYIQGTNIYAWLTENVTFDSPAIYSGASIEEQLDAIHARCFLGTYTTMDRRWMLAITDMSFESPYVSPCTTYDEKEYSYKYVAGDDNGKPIIETNYVTAHIGKYSRSQQYQYDPMTLKYPWQDYYSDSLRTEIIDGLENASDNLNAIVQLINNELTCLGFPTIYSPNADINSVTENTKQVYDDLINKISQLDPYIKSSEEPDGWQSLANYDINLKPYKNRLNRIQAINNINNEVSNIQFFDNKFNSLLLDVKSILTSNAEYFADYINNDVDRLDVQILAISSYALKRDKDAQVMLSTELYSISSDYIAQLVDFNALMLGTKRDEVYSINDDYSYNLCSITYLNEVYSQISDINAPGTPPYSPTIRYKDCLDYLLCGNYVDNYSPVNQLSNGVLNWIPLVAKVKFDDSIDYQVHSKVPQLTAYNEMTSLINMARSQYLYDSLDETVLITEKLDDLIEQIDTDISYISSEIGRYFKKKEIYLKYNGTEIGYDPFYNYKNQAYSSYQIHPYLYNFIEKSKLIYPLANNFFMSFGIDYEKDLYENSIDSILGPYGNIKDLWKSGMFDWTSYQSKYERVLHTPSIATGLVNPNAGFTGLFFPPAVDAYMADPNAFIQNVQDNSISSFYYHLNLTNEQIDKIVEQLIEYEPMIRTVAQRWPSINPALSSEFDIYKFAEDAYGNSLFLLKNYQYLYEKHANEDGYVPSYNEKKNAVGEIWMRIKDHPIAFPAFDLRDGYDKISQYNINQSLNSIGKAVNSYIKDIDDYFTSLDESNSGLGLQITKDTIGLSCIQQHKQHLRCFFDMELDPTRRTVLLVAPFYTGHKYETLMQKTTMTADKLRYANSSIVLSFVDQSFDYNNNVNIYNFSNDTYVTKNGNVNINNIANVDMLVLKKNDNISIDDLYFVPASTLAKNSPKNYYTQFIGFAKNGTSIYVVYARKNYDLDTFASYDTNGNYISNAKPQLVLRCYQYKCHINPSDQIVYSDPLEYDIFSVKREKSNKLFGNALNTEVYSNQQFKNAENLVIASSNKQFTIGYVTERIQVSPRYDDNLSIVNFVEYTSMVDKKINSSTYGENDNYPASTAMIQTTDEAKINIYNSFDSFVQHLANVNFKISNSTISYSNTKYFNLNGDIGFLPQYVDKVGTSRIYGNSALSGKSTYSIALLGPEDTDIEYSPVIIDVGKDKYGRVVEEYEEYNKLFATTSSTIVVPPNSRYSNSYVFQLSDIFPKDDWYDLNQTNELLRYKYILYNTSYEARPICKGFLSAALPSDNMYESSELYDLLSGDEIIGPNKTTYQNISLTNHINNVSNIGISVIYDEMTLLPSKIEMKVAVRQTLGIEQVIPAEQFKLFIYAKNNMKSYEYYHLFENANKNISYVVDEDQQYSIDFGTMSVDVGSYMLPNTTDVKPFANIFDVSKYNKMSAMLEFKYSEEDKIDREFPYLDASNVEDEIVIPQNDSTNTYFFALDSFRSLSSMDAFFMDTYDPNASKYVSYRVIPSLPKYRDFYDRALTIEATYNVEQISDNVQTKDKYEIVEYFNYKNFTDPQYINYIKGRENNAPSAYVYSSTDDAIKHSYLVLRPGESGRLDISVDFVRYGKLNDTAINQSVLGYYPQNIMSYYIMNVSDSKPKFVVSRIPFSAQPDAEDDENYELKDKYYSGMTFRYAMMVIQKTRNINDNPMYAFVAMSKIKFLNKYKQEDISQVFQKPDDTTASIYGGNVVVPNYPINLLDYADSTSQFFASNINFAADSLSIMFDFKTQAFDVEAYPYWAWYNSSMANSHVWYMPQKFYIAFSNDKKRWYKADSFYDERASLPSGNYKQAYLGQLSISQL